MNDVVQPSADDRFRRAFAKQNADHHGRVIPYFTAGFPDASVVEALMLEADALGVPVIELGIPYSDSIADGPVIQNSFYHALDHGFRVEDALKMVSSLRPRLSCAVVAMLSFSIVHRLGLTTFFRQAADAGFDGIILPDVPHEESADVHSAARARSLACIGMVGPRTDRERSAAIAKASTGFVYLIASTGTTGERAALSNSVESQVNELRSFTDLPLCAGFGLSKPAQVREVCAFADAAIVGSAIINRLSEAVQRGNASAEVVENIVSFLTALTGR